MKTQLFRIVTQRGPSFLASFGSFSRPQKGLVRKNAFREAFISLTRNFFDFQMNFFLTSLIQGLYSQEIYALFTKIRTNCCTLYPSLTLFEPIFVEKSVKKPTKTTLLEKTWAQNLILN